MKYSKREIERIEQLERCIPSVWDQEKILYIGASVERFHFAKCLEHSEAKVYILEVVPERYEKLKDDPGFMWPWSIRCMDVLHAVNAFSEEFFSMVLWSHGPEILPKERFAEAMTGLEWLTSDLVIAMCPWGRYPYKKDARREDQNVTALYPEDFEQRGYEVDILGKKDTKGSNLLAWWRK